MSNDHSDHLLYYPDNPKLKKKQKCQLKNDILMRLGILTEQTPVIGSHSSEWPLQLHCSQNPACCPLRVYPGEQCSQDKP